MHTGESRQIIRHGTSRNDYARFDGEHDEEDNEKDTTNKGAMGKGSRREERYYIKGNGHEVRKGVSMGSVSKVIYELWILCKYLGLGLKRQCCEVRNSTIACVL